ncbi:MAG: universal stress protein [Acidobacteriota bacterium]
MEGRTRILFPVDLAGISSKIVPEVLQMASRMKAEIHLLYVAECLEQFTAFYVPHPSLDQFEDEITRSAKRKLEEFAEEHFMDYGDTKTVIVRGDPAEEILKYIGTERIDLVIIGTHGRKGLDRVLFGSVADQVVKLSPTPVLSVNPYRKEITGAHGIIERWSAGEEAPAFS